jgi:hypothetical protein
MNAFDYFGLLFFHKLVGKWVTGRKMIVELESKPEYSPSKTQPI